MKTPLTFSPDSDIPRIRPRFVRTAFRKRFFILKGTTQEDWRMTRLSALILILVLTMTMAVAASDVQLAAPNEMGVTMGQLHYIVRDVAANQKFWVTLGASTVKTGKKAAVLNMPDLLIFLDQGEPAGPLEGSVLDHIGLRSSDIVGLMAKLNAAGYKAEPAPSQKAAWNSGGRRETIYVWGPEGQRLEVMQDGAKNTKFTLENGQEVPRPKMDVVSLHHVHWAVPESSVKDIQTWYVKYFGAVPGKRWSYAAADLPGLNFNFSGDAKSLAPSKGRLLDHIGFEVKNLQAFCKKLEANGVKFDKPYKKQRSGMATAYLTDPWGTYIELTEGVTRHY
jgi:catechol 2,3-dioxygenase-like lactoylglutathione lyase family enzyme